MDKLRQNDICSFLILFLKIRKQQAYAKGTNIIFFPARGILPWLYQSWLLFTWLYQSWLLFTWLYQSWLLLNKTSNQQPATSLIQPPGQKVKKKNGQHNSNQWGRTDNTDTKQVATEIDRIACVFNFSE